MSEERYEGIRHASKTGKPTYIMIPRKLLIAGTIAYLCMLVMTVSSVYWANYVDTRSNQRWCGIVKLFNETYNKEPPSTQAGKTLQKEFLHLQIDFKCK